MKIRSDAWYAALSEDRCWALYETVRHMNFVEALDVIEKNYPDLPLPKRTAWYKFLETMREADQERRIERAAQSAAEATKFASCAGVADAHLIETYKTLGADIALRTGDSQAAERFTHMAMAIADRALKRKELALKVRAQETKDEQLRLAREKFEAAEKRLNAAAEVVASPSLTPEQRDAELKRIFGLK